MPTTHPPPLARPRGLWKARANATSRSMASSGKKVPERKEDGTLNSSDTTDDERDSHSSSTTKARRKYSPSSTTLSSAAEDDPHHNHEVDQEDDDSFYYWDFSRLSSPPPSQYLPPPERVSKWTTRSKLMDTSSTATRGTQIDRDTCDYDDWEDLKELFAKAAEQYESDDVAEALPLLRGVIHECHRFLITYDDPSVLFTNSNHSTGIGPSISGGPLIRPKKDWSNERTSSIGAPTAPRDVKSKYGELPTAFHAIFGTALFLFGNLIAQEPSLALEGEPIDPIPYWFAALDIFETGENLPSRTNGRHAGLPEDWRMAIVWGRTLVCIADEIVTRTRKAKDEAAASAGAMGMGLTPGVAGAAAVSAPGMSGMPGIPGVPAFNPYAAMALSPASPGSYVSMNPFQPPNPYGLPVMSPLRTAMPSVPILGTSYGGFAMPTAAYGAMFPGSSIPYLMDEPSWPPESPFSAIASRRPPRTWRTTLARQSPNQLMKSAVDQFTRGIFFMPHARRQIQLPSMAGGGTGASATGLRPVRTQGSSSVSIEPGTVKLGIGLSQTNTGAIPASSTQPPFLPPFAGGASASVVTSRAALPGVQESFSRAKELFTIASEVLLLAEKLDVPSERKTWAAWADSVFNQMKMEADMDAWRGPITRARGRCWLIIGSAPMEIIEPALERGEDDVLHSERAKEARDGLLQAMEFFEKAKCSTSVVSTESKEQHVKVLEELRPLMVEALLTLGNLEIDDKKRQEYYDRAKLEAGDMDVDLMDDDSDADESSKGYDEGDSSMEVV
ncbi:hypothetical protein AX16_009249 [Volvariella volvacea WC 439]|nr:hypothetical protein AX16_009249 [Volvariella volvacea WC 439]